MTLHSKYDTFEKRLLAGFIDGFIFLAFSLLITRQNASGDKILYLVLTCTYIVCWTLYLVIGHGKYGQTIGKHLMGIKVLDIGEEHTIGYKKAFYREAIWFVATTIGVLYFVAKVYSNAAPENDLSHTFFEEYVRSPNFLWFVVEMLTMFFSKKRRALQDLISRSVVVDLNEMRREDLQKRQEELHPLFQNK